MTEPLDQALSGQIDAAVAEYLEAIESGAPIDVESFLARHSVIAGELRRFLDDFQSINRVMSPRAGNASTNSEVCSTGGEQIVTAPQLPLPRPFGNFELLEEIARGGMGVVYKARQKNPDRVVALKMILAGQLASQAEVDRFSAEAHAAAALDHPSIVPIFEVGQYQGQHYFTMGFVDGESLAQRLLWSPLAAREAAAITAEVAQAVEYAHTRGVVHRDLKPANILLDSDGRVRITDFGLAKRQTDESGLTCSGQLLGTPSFMSPEQVVGESARIGPTSDVYSLGATLYALLTGRPPFAASRTIETLRQVMERDPVPPRDFDAGIPRDLETIVLKALAKESSSRYQSAEGLADDLRRFLADRPVLARRSTTRERFLRWCRRNKVVASLCAAMATTLIVGSLASTWQAVRATRAERLAESRLGTEKLARAEADNARAAETDQRKAAEDNFRKARRAVDTYFTLVSESTLFDVPGLEMLRKELLEGALDFYEGAALEHSDDPAVLADAAVTQMRVSQIYLTLAQPDESVRALQEAMVSVTRLLRDYPHATEAHLKLAGSWKGRRSVSGHSGVPKDMAGAMRTLSQIERTWTELSKRYPGEPAFQSDLAAYEGLLGEVLETIDRSRESATAHGKSRAILVKLVRDNPAVEQYRIELARCTLNLVRMLKKSGNKQAETLPLAREALASCESLIAQSPDNVACLFHLHGSHAQLANLLQTAGQGEEAERHMRTAMEIAERLVRRFPLQRPFLDGWWGTNAFLVAIAEKVGDRPGLEKLFESRIRIAELVLSHKDDDEHVRILLAQSLVGFAGFLSKDLKRTSDAQRWNRRAAQLVLEIGNSGPSDRDRSLHDRELIAWRLQNLIKDTEQQESTTRDPLLRRTLALHAALAVERPDRPEHLEQVGHLHRVLSGPFYFRGEFKESAAQLEQAAQAFQELSNANIDQRRGHYQSLLAETLGWIADNLDQAGQTEEALVAGRRSASAHRQLALDYPKNDQFRLRMSSAVVALAWWLEKSGKPDEAEANLRDLIATVADPLDAYQGLARLLARQGKLEDARAALQAASEQKSTDPLALNNFAWLLASSHRLELRNPARAVEVAEKAAAMQPKNTQFLNTLGVAQYRAGKWQDAMVSLAKAEELTPGQTLAYNGFFLAMAHWQLDHKDEARTWYDKSVQWMEKNQPKNDELIRFRLEAEQLLGITEPDAAPTNAL